MSEDKRHECWKCKGSGKVEQGVWCLVDGRAPTIHREFRVGMTQCVECSGCGTKAED